MLKKIRNLKESLFGSHTKRSRVLIPAICIALAVILLVTLVLSGAFDGYEGTTVDNLKKEGVLKVAVIENSQPYGWLDTWKSSHGIPTGLELYILDEVCDELGLTMEVEVLERDKAIQGVAKGKYHLLAGGFSSSVFTEYPLQYTNPYSNIDQMILCKIDGPFENFNSLPTAKLAVRRGTHAEVIAVENGYTHTAYPTTEKAVKAVEDGTADAAIVDRWAAATVLKNRPQTGASGELVMLNAKITSVGYCFAMAPGSDEVIHEINVTVSKLAADGVLSELFANSGAEYYSPY